MPFRRKLVVSHKIAVLDRIRAGINCGLYAGSLDGMDRNLQMLTVCLFDHRRQFPDRKALTR